MTIARMTILLLAATLPAAAHAEPDTSPFLAERRDAVQPPRHARKIGPFELTRGDRHMRGGLFYRAGRSVLIGAQRAPRGRGMRGQLSVVLRF